MRRGTRLRLDLSSLPHRRTGTEATFVSVTSIIIAGRRVERWVVRWAWGDAPTTEAVLCPPNKFSMVSGTSSKSNNKKK